MNRCETLLKLGHPHAGHLEKGPEAAFTGGQGRGTFTNLSAEPRIEKEKHARDSCPYQQDDAQYNQGHADGLLLAGQQILLEFRIEKSGQVIIRTHHPQLDIKSSNVPPAFGVHMADFDKFRSNQRVHGFGFEKKMLQRKMRRISDANEIGQFLWIIHGISPAALHRAQKGLDLLGMPLHLIFSRDQTVAVEIHAVIDGPDERSGNTARPHVVGFTGQVGAHGVNPSGQKVIDIP